MIKSSKTMMLNIQMDASDSQEEQQQKICTVKQERDKKQGNYQAVIYNHLNKFASSAVTKGLFHDEDQFEYCVDIAHQNRQYEIQKDIHPTSQPQIKMIDEIEHSDDLCTGQDIINLKNQQAPKQQNVLIMDHPLSKKLLDIYLSESEQSDEQPQLSVITNSTKQDYFKEHFLNLMKLEKEIDPLTYRIEKEYYTTKHLQKGCTLHMMLKRDDSGFNTFWPEFELMFGTNQNTVLYAKKMMGNTTSNFYISTARGVSDVSHVNFIAKMRSNYLNSIYNVFNRGASPKEVGKSQQMRQILATIVFKSQQIPNTPRQFEVFILQKDIDYKDLFGFNANKEIDLSELYKHPQNLDKIHYFKNTKPIYSEYLKGYILNFSGRVQQSSIKNFILEDPISHQQVLMLGKCNDNIFRMDVSHPMRLDISLCICLANFDSKFVSQ